MNEQEQCEPLSFKGQMAARYRERLSMGFALANANKGDANDSSAGPSAAPAASDAPGNLVRNGVFRTADQATVASEPSAGTSSNQATDGLPKAVRSKSSLGENQGNGPKPTMKDLITKFETRFFTSNQLRQGTEEDGEKHRIARDAWGSSCPRIKMELDPSAMTSSSSSDVVDSKSSLTLSKPPYAKTSRATLSLNHEANTRLQMLQCLNRPRSRPSVSNTQQQLGAEDQLNVTNSHYFTDNQTMNTNNQPQADNNEEVPATKEDETNTFAGHTESLPDKPDKTEKEPKLSSDEQESSAVRVNLRDYAQRRKNVTENKYIVHTKDWGKRLQKKDTTGSSAEVVNYEGTIHNTPSSTANDKDLSFKDNKSGVNKIKQNISSPHLPFTNSKNDTRSRSRQSERSDESKELPREESQRTKAMERYLQFLRSSNPPPLNPASNDAKAEKTDLRKSLRPPTPHRANQLHKGNNHVFRNSAHLSRETNQSTGMQEISRFANKTDRDARLEHLLLRRPRSRQSLMNESKEITIDPSGGDFFVAPAFSSTNSIDSNVCEYNNKLNTCETIGQPKTETSDIRFVRQVPPSKPTSKWLNLPGRNPAAKKFPKAAQIRPQSARAHEKSDTKQTKQVTSFLRARSSSAGKTLDPTVIVKKTISQMSSPGSAGSIISSNHVDPAIRQSSPNSYRNNEKEQKPVKFDASDAGSFLLTEDELADNDLVPVHLRERKPRDLSEQLSLVLSSSDDSQNARTVSKLKGAQFKKVTEASSDKRLPNVPEIIDVMDPQCLDDEARSASKTVFSVDHTTFNQNNPQESKRAEDNSRLFVLHGKRRSTNAATKALVGDYPTDDLIRHRAPTTHHPRLANSHFIPLASLNKTSDLSNAPTVKETKDMKEAANLTSNVVPDERKAGGYTSREGRERKLYEQFRATPEPPPSAHARGDSLRASGDSSVEKAFTYMMNKPMELGKPIEPARGSPSKKSTLQKATGQNSGLMREHTNNKKVDTSAEVNMLTEPLSRARDPAHRLTENVYNPFHFGHAREKEEAYMEGEYKTEKVPSASPQKKKRKSDHPKKLAKKKKKIEDVVEDSGIQIRSPLSPDYFAAKMPKSKSKETSRKEEEPVDNIEKAKKSDMFEQPMRRKSSGELSVNELKQVPKQRKDPSHTWSSRKVHSRDNSPSSAFSEYRLSPRNALFTPDKCSTRNLSSPPSVAHQCTFPVTKLTCEPTDRFPSKSHIPLLILSPTSSRSKLERLIQYRRWREAMMDCLHPSRLPLSESFRKTLDSAVMEEWALHCWQPSKDMYVDSQGVWWSASYQEVQTGSEPESLLGDGRLFSKEGILDFTARLPYMKVGPLRFLHATYVLMAVACVTLGHVGVRLYHCGGDDYEYYCQDDDLECLMQLFAQSR